jgi:hypothetical protein
MAKQFWKIVKNIKIVIAKNLNFFILLQVNFN